MYMERISLVTHEMLFSTMICAISCRKDIRQKE